MLLAGCAPSGQIGRRDALAAQIEAERVANARVDSLLAVAPDSLAHADLVWLARYGAQGARGQRGVARGHAWNAIGLFVGLGLAAGVVIVALTAD